MNTFTLLVALILAAPPQGNAPKPPQDPSSPWRSEIAQRLRELDSDSFDLRRNAAERLDQLVAKPELRPILSAEFHRLLRRADLSFEVRWHLTRWIRQLPAPPDEKADAISPQELDRLLRQLSDESYARRIGATERLDWFLGNPKSVGSILIRLKQRLADDEGGENREQLLAAYDRARRAWLLGDPSACRLPEVSDEQIGRWLDDLTAVVRPSDAAASHRVETAERELLDLLARDDYTAKAVKAIQSRLTATADRTAAARLKTLLDWTKPEMVAEYWQGRRQLGEQHLFVGVPSQAPGAAKPSHFDRIDEHTAHCVSGNSLLPGDYPVGLAFAHPRQEGAFFHIVNLPTPRRRMAYPCFVETDEVKRLQAISRRTLDAVLAEKRVLSEQELIMLECLDPHEVSRFAARHFFIVEDGSLPATGTPRFNMRPSRFGLICIQLALDGDKQAGPGLVEAIAKDRFMPPTSSASYHLPWIAAFSIANRDPWPGVDAWLADNVGRTEPLIEGVKSPPEIGATAAAILLKRHGRQPATFGLRPVGDPPRAPRVGEPMGELAAATSILERLHVRGYRFENAKSRQKAQDWWNEESRKSRTASASIEATSSSDSAAVPSMDAHSSPQQ